MFYSFKPGAVTSYKVYDFHVALSFLFKFRILGTTVARILTVLVCWFVVCDFLSLSTLHVMVSLKAEVKVTGQIKADACISSP